MAWRVTAKSATTGSEGEILMYDVIGGDDGWERQGAKAMIGQIKALGDIENITLRINSVGGDVFEAQAMYSYLRSHPARVTVRVDGLAASAASLVAMAGDRIVMPENALMMIHDPSGFVMGDAEDMRDMADILDKIRETIAKAYVAKTGLGRDEIVRMMDEETWMSADEALSLGFCDEVEGAVQIAATASRSGGLLCRAEFGSAALPPELAAKLPERFRCGAMAPIPDDAPEEDAPIEGGDLPEGEKEDEEMKSVTSVAELEEAFPGLVGEVRDAAFQNGVQAERDRLRALDGLAGPGRGEIIARAKYEDPKDARDVAIELLHADRSAGALAARFQDAGDVDGALQPQAMAGAREREEAFVDAIVRNIDMMRGNAR